MTKNRIEYSNWIVATVQVNYQNIQINKVIIHPITRLPTQQTIIAGEECQQVVWINQNKVKRQRVKR